ncbi:DUF6734 family protein [Prevotella amnii]|uniref:DUF6734 family protein n=1 Tax=Prevotella amnii TaxID=419005 RepID=UPI00336AA0EE
MKIIQSFWSKPLLKSDKESYQNRLNGGWPNLRYALAATSYSCLTLKKFYEDVELYTDDFGMHLFKDVLQLPYTKFHNVLNDLDMDELFWAYGKIVTYSLQNEPFLHIDNDIFIYNRFPDKIEEAELACQNIEWITPKTTDDYTEALEFLRQNVPTCPNIIFDTECRQAVNMGLFGGNNIDFIRRYAHSAMEGIKNAVPYILAKKGKTGVFNIIFEQLLLSEMAKKESIPTAYIIENNDSSDFSQYINLETAQFTVNYTHCVGLIKQCEFICEQMEYRLRSEFPQQYQNILDYLERQNMYFDINDEFMKYFDDFNQSYTKLKSYKTQEELMTKVSFKLREDVHLDFDGNSYWISRDGKSKKLERWGYFLAYFQDYITGYELSNYIIENKLTGDINDDTVRENIFHLIIQNVYSNRYLEVRID